MALSISHHSPTVGEPERHDPSSHHQDRGLGLKGTSCLRPSEDRDGSVKTLPELMEDEYPWSDKDKPSMSIEGPPGRSGRKDQQKRSGPDEKDEKSSEARPFKSPTKRYPAGRVSTREADTPDDRRPVTLVGVVRGRTKSSPGNLCQPGIWIQRRVLSSQRNFPL